MKKPITALLSAAVILAGASYFSLSSHRIDPNEEAAVQEGERYEGATSGAERQMSSLFVSRAYPDPTGLNEKYWKGWQQAQEIRARQQQQVSYGAAGRLTPNNGASIQSASWSSIGPNTTIGGRVVALTIDPNNYNNLFIGTASGGIYKSANKGDNWTYVPTGLPIVGIGDITYHPTNSSILLAGTGEVYRSDTSNIGYNIWKARGTYGIGILKSTDGGTSWTRVFTKETSHMFAIQELQYDPTNSNNVFACATDGIYKSIDGGDNWSQLWSKTYVRDLVIHPTDANIMVASVGNLSNPDRGIFRTTDGGSTWTKIGSALPASFPGYIKLEHFGSSRIYASIGRGGSNSELYMSTDFGVTWILKSSSSHCGGQYWFGHALAIDPNNQNRIVMGGVNYYVYTSTSTTNGNGSKSSFASGVHADVHDIEFEPGNSNIIYIACDGGMYRSDNGSTSSATFANKNNGLAATQFYASFAASPTSANVFIGGLQDNGTVKYNGTSWAAITGGDGGPAAFHPTNGNIAIYSNDARAVYHSTDAGASETQRMLNLGYGYSSAYDDRTGFMSPVVISKSNPAYMYVASDNLHISNNGGGKFFRAHPDSMSRYIDAYRKPAITLAVSPTDYNKMYVSTSPFAQMSDDRLLTTGAPDIRRSLNASDNYNYSFTSIKGNLPDRFVNDIAVSEADDDVVYVVLGGFGSSHVFRTDNAAATTVSWTDIGTGLPDVPFNAILLDPVRANTIYVAGDLGVYVSPNGGANWYDYNNGLWDNTALVLDIQKTSDDNLVIATHGKGIFVGPRYSGVLPVTVHHFTGQIRDGHNLLEWTVSGESDLRQYELERSGEGAGFRRIATITPANSSGPRTYTHKDIEGTSGTWQYRLKSVNHDGSYTYSEVVTLRRHTADGLQVLSNPFVNSVDLRFTLRSPGRGEVRLYNGAGKLLRRQPADLPSGSSFYQLKDLAALPAGIYHVEAVLGSQRWTRKLIKK